MTLWQMVTLAAPLAVIALLVFRFPEIGLVLCVVIGSFLKGVVQPYLGPIDVTVCLVAVTYFSILTRSLSERTFVLPDAKVNVMVGVFLLLLLASVLYTPVRSAGIDTILRFTFLTISMTYMTVMWCTSVDRVKRVLFMFVGSTLTYATATFILVFLVGVEASSGWRASIQGTPALGIAQLLSVGILTAIVVRGMVNSRAPRFLVDVLTLLAAVELVALNSRGPLFALVAGGACLLLLASTSRKRQALGVGAAVLTAVAFAFFLLPSRYTARYASFSDTSVAARIDMWQLVAEHARDWFFTGAGLGGFDASYLGDAELASTVMGYGPHNMFLGVFADAGFFALSVFVCLIAVLVYRGIRLCRTEDREFRSLGLAVVVPLVGLLVASQFGGALVSTRPIWLFGGLVLSLAHIGRGNKKVTE